MTLIEFIKSLPKYNLQETPCIYLKGIGGYTSIGITRLYENNAIKCLKYDFKTNTFTIELEKG